jgi:dienelactone hydrolase
VRPGLVAAVIYALSVGAAAAQPTTERVTFPSADGKTKLVASLMRPVGEEPRPALVLLHGCSGLQRGGRIFPLYRNWAQLFVANSYVVLIVDSAGSRSFGETCTGRPERRVMFAERPHDAYAALQYLQAQPFVRADRVGVVGWSQGGATILLAARTGSSARPAGLKADFRAAVALYPGLCDTQLQASLIGEAAARGWTTAIPLMVLQGTADNWTPAARCEAFMADAKARGTPVEFKLYRDAYHTFDAPNMALHPLPAYRMANGVVPLIGTDEAARADALVRVPEFLSRYLKDR